MLVWCPLWGITGLMPGGVVPPQGFTPADGASAPAEGGSGLERRAGHLNTRRGMVFSRIAQRMTSRAAAVLLVIGTVSVAIAAPAPTASAAGTVLFNQPFHDNTVDGPAGSVSLPTPGAGGANYACLTAVGNLTKNPLA